MSVIVQVSTVITTTLKVTTFRLGLVTESHTRASVQKGRATACSTT